MKSKYEKRGLKYDLIIEKYHDLNEYEQIVNVYLDDEFFKDLKEMLIDEDYAMAKDAVKGLYVLASDLYLYPLYERLLEIYEDLEYETYNDIFVHYDDMMLVHKRIRSVFSN